MIFAGILAGGKGLRMGMPDLPKQFVLLQDKPIVIHTLEKFLTVSQIDKICVAVHPDWVTYFEDLLAKYLPEQAANILITEGGADRNDSILNIIQALKKEYTLSQEDIILTHDSVRPFVTYQTLVDNIEAMQQYDVVDTVVTATDTIVHSADGKQISSIPNRAEMYQGQTPQTFKVLAFEQAYQQLSDEEKGSVTDACKVFLLNDTAVGLVNGSYANIKITTLVDLKIAQAMLAQ